MKNAKGKFEDLPELLDAYTISEYLGLSYNSTLNLIKYNMVHLKFGRYYRVNKNEFKKFLNQEESYEAVLTAN